MENRECPQCSKPDQKRYLTQGQGQLDQSGQTHLDTTTWTCNCGYKDWERAAGAPWVPNLLIDPLTHEVLQGKKP
jgi:hypothetical protein